MGVASVNLAWERPARLCAGLLLFAYATTHFISHATGLFLIDALQSVGRDILLAPWRTPLGLFLLGAAFLLHAALGLKALYRRRTLRIPAIEMWQLGLGLAIPLLLIPHVTNARLGNLLFGLDDSYFRVLYLYWLTDPGGGLPRQFALMLAIWIHGCVGIHMALRFRAGYRRWAPALLAAALAIPALAILGLTNAGWSLAIRAMQQPDFVAAYGAPAPNSPRADGAANVAWLAPRLQLAWIAIVAAILIARFIRDRRERARSVTVSYSGGRSVTAPRGFSILEASRWNNVPHASVCGGRGRCTTCRVRVLDGFDKLDAPAPVELAALARIGAPERVRLACQVRPQHDVMVAPLVPPTARSRGLQFDLRWGRELLVTALYIDLRDSTRIAAGRLPYDALFIVDRYIQAVTSAIQAQGGLITSVAGDGVMSVFGLDGDARAGARAAFAAAAALWKAVDDASADLADNVGQTLRFGVGVHSGLSIVGTIGPPGQTSIQFLGDTGNVAARLEALTKEMNCTAIASQASLDAAELAAPGAAKVDLDIRGRDGQPVAAHLIRERAELMRLAGAQADVKMRATA